MRKSILRIARVSLLLSVVLVLASCQITPSLGASATLMTYDEAVSRAAANCNATSLVSESRTDTGVTYTVTDGQYGFTYTIASEISSIGVMGKSMFHQEQHWDDYQEKYFEYIFSRVSSRLEAIKRIRDVTITYSHDRNGAVIYSRGINAASAGQAAEDIQTEFRAYDSRRNLVLRIVAVDRNNAECGECSTLWSAYRGASSMIDDAIVASAQKLIGKNAKLLYSVEIKANEVPGYGTYVRAASVTNLSQATCRLYYFKYNGETWFMTDFEIIESNGNVHYYYGKLNSDF